MLIIRKPVGALLAQLARTYHPFPSTPHSCCRRRRAMLAVPVAAESDARNSHGALEAPVAPARLPTWSRPRRTTMNSRQPTRSCCCGERWRSIRNARLLRECARVDELIRTMPPGPRRAARRARPHAFRRCRVEPDGEIGRLDGTQAAAEAASAPRARRSAGQRRAHFHLGDLHRERGDLDDAPPALRGGARGDARTRNLLDDLGLVLEARGDRDAAEESAPPVCSRRCASTPMRWATSLISLFMREQFRDSAARP